MIARGSFLAPLIKRVGLSVEMPVKLDDTYVLRLKNGENPGNVLHEFLEDGGDEDDIDRLGFLCRMGGWPDEESNPEYMVTDVSVQGCIATITCEVFFREKVYGGGCPDMPTYKERNGTVVYELDMESGKLA